MPDSTVDGTPGPQSKAESKVRKNVIRTVPLVGAAQLSAWEAENINMVKEALQNIVTLPTHCLREHQVRADTKPPNPSDPSWSPDDMTTVRPTKPTLVCDRAGTLGLLVIPSFLRTKSLDLMNKYTLDFMALELAPRYDRNGNRKIVGASTNGKARGGEDTYVVTDDSVVGTATYVLAYYQQAHTTSHSFEPSRSVTYSPSGKHFHLRGQFFSFTRNFHHRLNHMIDVIHPDLLRLLNEARPLLEEHPTVAQYSPIWDSRFLGHSVICNRTSSEHTDRNGLQRGLDVLLAAGTFSGGDIFFKDMNLKLQFEPGTLVLFDGSAHRHRILDWSGQQRISHAFFVHRFVFEELGLDCSLPDITTENIQRRIETLEAKPRVRKRKRHGRGEGRASKAQHVEV